MTSAVTSRLPVIPPTGKPELRRSEVWALLGCDQWGNAQSEAAAYGTAFHRFAETYWGRCAATGHETEIAEVDQLARDAWFGQPTGLNPDRYPEFHRLCMRFATTHLADLATYQGSEQLLCVETDIAHLRGTVDRIDRFDNGERYEPPAGRVRMTDYKTQYSKSDHVFQLKFYGAVGCLLWPDVEEVETAADHVSINNGVVRANYERAELLEWWGDSVIHPLGLYLARHRAGRLSEATGGAACQYCAHRLTCGAALSAYSDVPVDDAEAAQRFRRWLRIDAAHHDERELLKAYFEQTGSVVEVQGYEVGVLPPEESWRCVDPLGAIEVMRQRGVDPKPYLSVGKRGMPKALQDALRDAGVAIDDHQGDAEFKKRKLRPVRPPRVSQ